MAGQVNVVQSATRSPSMRIVRLQFFGGTSLWAPVMPSATMRIAAIPVIMGRLMMGARRAF
jgi:hypothetical protein